MKFLLIIASLACTGAGGLLWLAAKRPEARFSGRPLSSHAVMRDIIHRHHSPDGKPAGSGAEDEDKIQRRIPEGSSRAVVSDSRDARTNPSAGSDNSTTAGLRSPRAEESTARRARIPDKTGPPVLPLAFQDVDPGAVELDPKQAAAATAVQDDFADAVGSDPADPADADYHKKWQHEQPVSDQRLRAMIGGQAYVRWQREAWLKSESNRAETRPAP
jgi:hypothetical protein